MQVIHHYKGVYPFNREKELGFTFMQVSKNNLSQTQIAFERHKAKIYKNISSNNFIKLVKTLKEDHSLHLIYEYEDISLEGYIETLSKRLGGKLPTEKYKSLLAQFKSNIDSIIDALILAQIKVDVFLSALAYTPNQGIDNSLHCKAFIDPEAEYLSLINHDYRAKDGRKRDHSGINQQFLTQFYEAERKRLMLDFQELMEKNFGIIQEFESKKQFSNFIINGTKLVFVNEESKSSEKQIGKNIEKEQFRSFERDKQKMAESKTTGASERSRNQSPAGEKQFIKASKPPPPGPIVDFDQSFQPQFHPEEFLKEKTYIYEEGDYLQSLEEELNHMAIQKKIKKQQFSKPLQVVSKPETKIVSAPKTDQPEKKKDLTVSQDSNQKNNYSGGKIFKQNASFSNNSNKTASNNNDSYDPKNDSKDSRTDKMNKYKMKIITSHQIEIEGGGEEPNVQEIEKQIIEGIKTGKIKINELAIQNKDSKEYIQPTKEKPDFRTSLYNSDHRDDKGGEGTQNKRSRHDSDGGEVDQRGGKMHKIKGISQILQKIGIKQTQEAQQAKEAREQQQHLNWQVNSKTEGIKHQKQSPETPTLMSSSTPQHKIERTDDKKADKYIDKIRQAKNKAEQLLKQYTKKK